MRSRRLKGLASVLVLSVLVGCGDAQDPAASAAAGSEASATQTAAHAGKKIYDEFCFSCHAAGLNGAPKLGDAEAWAPRIAKGRELLLQTTIEGIPPAMPPRGICMSCTDEELAAAIDYMIGTSQN